MKFLVILAGILLSTANASPDNVTEVTGKVIGGNQASAGQYPYMASLRLASGQHFCGGSIISNTWILTAAHCLQAAKPGYVVVGSLRISTGGSTYPVAGTVVHPNYNPVTNANDIAMVRLGTKIQFGAGIQPIAIRPDYVGEVRSVLTGWGYTSYPGDVSDTLKYVHLNTISEWSCKQMWESQVGPSNICTFTGVGEGSCHADSGGPLVANGQQIGIVSFGYPCAVGMPDVYTRTSSFYQWILQTMSR